MADLVILIFLYSLKVERLLKLQDTNKNNFAIFSDDFLVILCF